MSDNDTEMTEPMSKEEMIDILKGLVFGTFDRTTAKEREALDMAIKVLEQESKTRQENINAVLEDIVDWATHHDYGFINVNCSIRHGVYLDELIEYIKSIYCR